MVVLIVEDNSISAKIEEATLKKQGYETLIAGNGEEALAHLESGEAVQLLIVDVLMPKMSGVDLVREIKKRPEWRDIPIVMCTGIADVETVKDLAALGCKYYLVKPISTHRLVQKVQQALAGQRPVLQNPYLTLGDLGLDRPSFLEIAGELAGLIGEEITLLEQRLKGTVDAAPKIHELLEGAKLLGARRVSEVLEKLNNHSAEHSEGDVLAQYPLLLRELKLLRRELLAYLKEFTSLEKNEAGLGPRPVSALPVEGSIRRLLKRMVNY